MKNCKKCLPDGFYCQENLEDGVTNVYNSETGEHIANSLKPVQECEIFKERALGVIEKLKLFLK